MHKPSHCCGIQKAVSLIGNKWVLVILHELCCTHKGFNELLRSVEGISPRILSLRLTDLIEHGLVKKKIIREKPILVEYSLTRKGASLKKIISDLGEWADAI